MNEKFLPLFIVIFLILVSAFYNKRIIKEHSDLDLIEEALLNVKPILNPNVAVSLQEINLNENPDNLDIRAWVKYVLVPIHITDKKILKDTMLTICLSKSVDSVSSNVLDKKRILWKYDNNHYAFFLTIAKLKYGE